MAGSELEQWEAQLSAALTEVDSALEQEFQGRLTRRAGRPAAGETSNAKYDGMFSLDAKFSLGINTGDGPGYTIDVRTSVNEYIGAELHQEILDKAKQLLPDALNRYLPENELHVRQIGCILRITGNMDFRK